MARTVLTPIKLARNVFSGAVSENTAIDATLGAEFLMNDSDEKYLIIVENSDSSAEKTVTIKAGNAPQGTSDLSQTLAAGEIRYINIESGKFKNVSGPDAGKVIITGTDAKIKASVYILP